MLQPFWYEQVKVDIIFLIMSKNPYSILNISEDANYEEIKDSYLHLSRNLHPDKQPLQNYHMAKQHFQIIDKAYKSIASPLRRFVFKEFGLKGIGLMDEFPIQFKHFQGDSLNLEDKLVQKKIRNLIIYMLHEDHATNQTDKSKFATKSIINLSRILRPDKHFSSAIKIPQIQKNTFNYQMPLPEVWGFSNRFAISQQAVGLQKTVGSTLDFSLSSMRRVRKNVLMHVQTSANNNSASFDLNADWIVNNSMQVRFNPISITNGQVSTPKIGVDKVFNNCAFSAITDFQHVNIDISDNNGQKGQKSRLSKSVKIMVERNAIMLVPKIQFDLTKDLKIILQLMGSLQEENTLNFGLNYGYKIKLNQEYKLELMSFTGAQNYFQVSLYSPKFRVNIPFLSSGDAVKLQSYKVLAFLLSFLAIKGYAYIQAKNQTTRKRIVFQEYNRLSEQKLSITKATNQVSSKANQKLQKQLKHNGLIIVRAFLGQYRFVSNIGSLIKKMSLKDSKDISQVYEDLRQKLENQMSRQDVQYGDIQHQLYDVTDLFRSSVKGSQIIGKRLHEYHPLLNQQSTPYVIAIYLNRGKLGVYFQQNSKPINIGGLIEHKSTILKRVKSCVLDWLW